MTKIYIYPTYTPSRDKSGNMYIKLFHDAFGESGKWRVVNRLWQVGIASLFFNLDAKVFIIQWVDLIPGKQLGKLQFLFFMLGMGLLRLLRKKIVWVLHNKRAHEGESRLVDLGMKLMARVSTTVVAHSEEGVRYFDKLYPAYAGKCVYIPHPVYSTEKFAPQPPEWDYVVWGSVVPRKNVAEFLEAVAADPRLREKKILICGSCRSQAYAQRIEALCGPNVTFMNRFLSDEELRRCICRSRCVVFTYNVDSVLSSGALIYSLNFGKPIIGPNVGSFADLRGIVVTYDSFEDIPGLSPETDVDAIDRYLAENRWDTLPDKIASLI